MSFFQNLVGYITSLRGVDLAIALGYLVAFFVSWFITRWLLNVKFKKLPQIHAVIYALQAVLFTVIALVSYKYINDPILKILYRDTAVSVAAALLAGAVFSFVRIGKVLRLITYLGFFLALIVEIVIIFTTNLGLLKILIPLRKFLILLSLFPILYALTELISVKRFKKVLRTLLGGLFLTIGLLWELGYVNFDITAFVGIGIIVATTLVYSWFISHGTVVLTKLFKVLQINEDDGETLLDSLKKLGFLLLLYIYWIVGIYYLNLEKLVQQLKGIILFDTPIVKISLFNLLASVYLFLFLFYLINILKKVVKLIYPPQEREDKGGSIEAVVYNLGMLLNITLSLSAMGLTWKAILPLAGALGIGLGFGLQTILNNYVSGFILMFSRNIRVGDFVELPGNAGQFINNPSNYIFGRVEDISILTTRIRTLDGIDILVPNSTFIGNQIINYSLKNPFVRVRFPFGVAYSSDPDKVKEILIKLAYDCPWAKNYYRPPQVWFTSLGDSALLFELLMWVDIRELWKNPYKTLSYSLVDWVYTNGFKRLKEANIEIPFPQQDIWFRNNLKVVIENEEGKTLGVLKKEDRTKDV